jgi:hypothetical protein
MVTKMQGRVLSYNKQVLQTLSRLVTTTTTTTTTTAASAAENTGFPCFHWLHITNVQI